MTRAAHSYEEGHRHRSTNSDVTETPLNVPIRDVNDETNLIHARTERHRRIEPCAVSSDRRLAATQAHQQAIATINEMFDRLDELTAARDRLTGIAPRQPDDDPIQDAELLLDHARRLAGALEALRAAALAAADHRTRSELAADIGTKNNVLFPRQGAPRVIVDPERRTVRMTPEPGRPGTAGPGSDSRGILRWTAPIRPRSTSRSPIPAPIAHVVADVLVGRCVRLTWSSRAVDDDADAPLGVTSAAVEVVGCCVDGSGPLRCSSACTPPTTGSSLGERSDIRMKQSAHRSPSVPRPTFMRRPECLLGTPGEHGGCDAVAEEADSITRVGLLGWVGPDGLPVVGVLMQADRKEGAGLSTSRRAGSTPTPHGCNAPCSPTTSPAGPLYSARFCVEDQLVVGRSIRTRLLALPARLVNRSGRPTLRMPSQLAMGRPVGHRVNALRTCDPPPADAQSRTGALHHRSRTDSR